MNELIGMGVAGFRIDAAKHMWPADLKLILDRLHYLPTEIGVPPRTKPFIFQQVIDLGSMYMKQFHYFIVSNKDSLRHLDLRKFIIFSNIEAQWP